jgi:hypothetical protein
MKSRFYPYLVSDRHLSNFTTRLRPQHCDTFKSLAKHTQHFASFCPGALAVGVNSSLHVSERLGRRQLLIRNVRLLRDHVRRGLCPSRPRVLIRWCERERRLGVLELARQ